MTDLMKVTLEALLSMSRKRKKIAAIAFDVGICVLCVWLAFYLRLGTNDGFFAQKFYISGLSVLTAIPVFAMLGSYNVIFRYNGIVALASLLRASILYGVVFAILVLMIGIPNVPRTIGLIQPILLFLLIASSRIMLSTFFVRYMARQKRPTNSSKALIYGAGASGRELNAAIATNSEIEVVAFLDDSLNNQGQILDGKIVYSPSKLRGLVEKFGIQQVLLAMPSVSRARRNKIIQSVKKARVAVRTLPSVLDLAQGRVTVSDIRELDVDELLGRERVAPISELLTRDIKNKSILVSGAGGSIGSELCRQIIKLNPNTLVLLDISESALYEIHQELLSKKVDIKIVPLLASVRNKSGIDAILSTWKIDTIYHAAAYKHVPLVEYNIVEGLENNIFGTLVLVKSAIKHQVSNFVLISTDKAVRPTNIMGASKRVAEITLQALSAENQKNTKLAMVRFGNVLGSSGSVVLKFREQIKNGGPVTITHPEITRYFMTIPEAAELVIQAGAMASGGEVFLLDMDTPVKIMDLARRMIESSGQKIKDNDNPEGDIEIKVIGLRPGEKLYEELLISAEAEPTPHKKIMKAHEAHLSWNELSLMLETLKSELNFGDVDKIQLLIQGIVDDYRPKHETQDLRFLEIKN